MIFGSNDGVKRVPRPNPVHLGCHILQMQPISLPLFSNDTEQIIRPQAGAKSLLDAPTKDSTGRMGGEPGRDSDSDSNRHHVHWCIRLHLAPLRFSSSTNTKRKKNK